MIEENAGLSKQGLQNLRTLTQGASDFGAVRRALQVLDLDEESITRPRAHFVDSLGTAPETYLEGVEGDYEDTEDDSEAQRETLKEISDLDLTEHEAQEVLLAMDRDDHHGKQKKKTWTENQRIKKVIRKDRRHPEDRTSHREKVVRKKRISPEELKKITKCANCGERGHWKAECKNPYKPPASRPSDKNHTAFVYLGTSLATTAASSSEHRPSYLVVRPPALQYHQQSFRTPSGQSPGISARCVGVWATGTMIVQRFFHGLECGGTHPSSRAFPTASRRWSRARATSGTTASGW